MDHFIIIDSGGLLMVTQEAPDHTIFQINNGRTQQVTYLNP